MTGTLLNSGAIILGGTLGTFLGAHLPEKLKQSVFLALGIFSLAFGIQMFLKTENPIIPLISLLTGVLVGEWLKLEERVKSIEKLLETRLLHLIPEDAARDGRFMKGFISASMLYCVGPMSILGSIQNGLTGEYSTLAVKSVLDGFASLAFSSILGMGIVFSSIPVFIYQGTVTLFAIQVQSYLTPSMINEFTSVGGIILAAIAISGFLEIKPIRTTSFLPALLFAPIIAWMFSYI